MNGPLHTFRTSSYCKRSCLFCVLNSDTVVLDSEWHWIFDCPQFSPLRDKYPKFLTVLRSIRENSIEENFSIESDLRRLFHSILDDSKCGFSLVAFLNQALTLRKTWLDEVCVRGHPGAPPPPPPTPGPPTPGCEDERPPSSRQYSCAQQKGWGKCGESWMKGYCCKTCFGCASGCGRLGLNVTGVNYTGH